jgi:hypothetical protein
MSQHYHKTTEGMMDKIQETLLGPPQQHTPIGVLFYLYSSAIRVCN